ncbi:MAG: TonB-dependent receptor, partial [Rhodanobacter sp.]
NYNFTENVMGYVSDTTGFQSGGYNGRASTAAAAVAVSPERVNSAEIGVKSTLFDGRMHLNADYYYANWAAMQLSGTLPTGEFRLTNATGALIQGFEVEGQVQLSQRWRADVGLSTINAKYRNYSAANIPTFAGKDLKKAPRFQWNLSSTYIQPLASADVAWSLQLKYTDFYFGAQNNDPVAKTGAHLDAAARISYEPRSANWSAALWGKNLTNNHLAGGLNIPSLGMVIRTAVEPRTYGIDFTYRFF